MSLPKALWKLTIDPRGKTDPEADSFAFCQERSIVGVGWGFDTPPSGAKQVRACYRTTYPGSRFAAALRIILERVAVGDHVWVYGKRSYYVCRLESEWQYEDGGEWDRHDIHNFREANWCRVSEAMVPGIIRRKLTMYGAAQLITEDLEWRRYSKLLYEGSTRISPTTDVTVLGRILATKKPSELFAVLDPDDVEDVVGVMLQHRGWRMLKSSTYRSQRDIECIFRWAGDGPPRTAYLQVKSGLHTTLDPADYNHLLDPDVTVFLFSTARQPYITRTAKNIELISQQEVAEFLVGNISLWSPAMTLRLALWSGASITEGSGV